MLWLLRRALAPPAQLANEGGIVGPDVARHISSAKYRRSGYLGTPGFQSGKVSMESPEPAVDVESTILQRLKEPRQLASEPSTEGGQAGRVLQVEEEAGSLRTSMTSGAIRSTADGSSGRREEESAE